PPSESSEGTAMARPLSRYLSWSFTNSGISMRQGPHHVAQKSRITTLPLKSDRWTFLPETSASSKSGAVDPRAPGSAVGWALPFSDSGCAQPNASTNASAVRTCFLEDRIVFLQFVVGD